MSKTLIITEKPSVAQHIAKVAGARKKGEHAFEGERYIVTWALGHMLELVPPEKYDDKLKRWRLQDLPVLPAEFRQEPIRKTSKQLRAIVKLLKRKEVAEVINGCDAGREGERIYWEIYRHANVDKPVRRLWLQSMTDASIRSSLEEPRTAAELAGLADAADCRAEADWLIGMNATRAVTVRLRSRRERTVLSAGRVQTPTLAMVVRRELEILSHEPEPYWVITAKLRTAGAGGHDYEGVWFDPDADGPKDRIFSPERRDAVVELLARRPRGEASETRKDSRESAPAMFDLTTLQREANKRFGFSARRTLQVAQALYEEHELITYPRTDSRALPSDYVDTVHRVLGFLGGREAYAAHVSRLRERGLHNGKRNFDDRAVSDHFAIIPTGEGKPGRLNRDEARVFDVIVRQFLGAFHPPAVWTQVERVTRIEQERFRTNRRVLKTPGWRAVWEREAEDAAVSLPPLPGDDSPVEVVEHTAEDKLTKPPARLTEAALLRLMETAGKEVDDTKLAGVLKATGGLGTPATRADTIETLLSRDYVERCLTLDKRKALRATARGIRLIDALERIEVPGLTSVELTGALEEALAEVEHGRRDRTAYMKEVRSLTSDIVDKLREFTYDVLYAGEEPLGPCPACGGEVRETLRSYSCVKGLDGGDCQLVIWKEVSGRYIDRRTAVQLLEKKVTPVIGGFFNRRGEEYEASLVLGEDLRVEVQTPGRDGVPGDAVDEDFEVVDVGPCPFHPDQRVLKTPRGFRCELFAKKQCKLNLPLQPCKRPLTDDEAKQLLGPERKTDLLGGFISKRGRPFSATLHLEDNGRIRWEFPPRGSGAQAVAAKRAPAKEFPVDPTPLGKCPQHPEADIVETPTEYACTVEGCKVRAAREICQRALSRDEAKALLTEGETPVLDDFISKRGKPFSAALYRKKRGNVGFRFDS